MRAMNKHPVHHITDTLGVEAVTSRLGVSRHAIRYARTMREFPPAWYAALKDMCEEVGIPCPIYVFSWKDTAKKYGKNAAEFQGRIQKSKVENSIPASMGGM